MEPVCELKLPLVDLGFGPVRALVPHGERR
jgi:hypothetical protein